MAQIISPLNVCNSRQYCYNLPYIGILADGNSNYSLAPSLSIGTSNATANYFSNCGTGIWTRYPVFTLTASRNYFRGVDYGIHVNAFSFSSSSYNCNIVGNSLVDVRLGGIWMDLNTAINADIEYNNMYYSSPSTRNFTSKGIIANENNSSTALYNISNNTLTYPFTGIECLGTYKSQIVSNAIQVNSPPTHSPGVYNYGINNVNCNFNSIGSNTIKGDNQPYNWGEYGINSVDHPNQNIFCNTITGVNTGLNLQGHSPTPTNPDLPIRNNDLHECLIDVWMLNNCVIGPQRSTLTILNTHFYFPIDNTFHHTTTATTYTSSYCSNFTMGTQSPFYIQCNGLFNMPKNFASPSFGNSPMTPVCVAGGFPNPCDPGGTAHRIFNLAHLVAVDSVFPVTDVRNRFVSSKALFANIQLENFNTSTDAALASFTSASFANNFGKLFSIEQNAFNSVAQANPSLRTQAQQANNSFSPTNSFEVLHQKVNEAYLNYLATYTFTTSDLSTLRQIASLCPFTDGSVVWQARALLAGVDSIPYQNACEVLTFPSGSGGHRLAQVAGESNDLSVGIYPNPNAGTFTVALSGKYQAANVEVFNTVGASVLIKQFENTSSMEISDLPEGAYVVKVTGDGVLIKTERIIVIR